MGGEIPMDDVREKKKKEPESEDTHDERPVKQKESAAKEIKNGTEKTPNSNKKTSPPAAPEETNEALKAQENAPEVSITDNTDLNNQSRFSRWFSKTPDEEKSKVDSLESPHSDASGKEGADNKDNVNAVPNVETPEKNPFYYRWCTDLKWVYYNSFPTGSNQFQPA
uniref:Uncharacterized protein n=1 Tax=Ciona savignyi TaxID=51511 RepID=H2Z9T1_CIOSA